MWSSWALINAVIATKPSPPGRFSTTTAWPHFAASFSAISRAPMSAPAPGPSGRMTRTVRVGQFCAAEGSEDSASDENATAEPIRIWAMRMIMPPLLDIRACIHQFAMSDLPLKADPRTDIADVSRVPLGDIRAPFRIAVIAFRSTTD
jgi:hypothetical protein